MFSQREPFFLIAVLCYWGSADPATSRLGHAAARVESAAQPESANDSSRPRCPRLAHGWSSPPKPTLCALAQALPRPHTSLPGPPGSATALLASRGLRPAGLPRVNGRWPACSAHARRPATPSTAGRAGGSADRDQPVLPVVGLRLAPGRHQTH